MPSGLSWLFLGGWMLIKDPNVQTISEELYIVNVP